MPKQGVRFGGQVLGWPARPGASIGGMVISPRRRTLANTELAIPVHFSADQVLNGGLHAKTRRSKSAKEIIIIIIREVMTGSLVLWYR